VQLFASIFNVIIVLQRKISFWGQSWHSRMLQSHISIEVTEIVIALLQLPLAVSTAHMYYIKNDIFIIN